MIRKGTMRTPFSTSSVREGSQLVATGHVMPTAGKSFGDPLHDALGTAQMRVIEFNRVEDSH